MKPQWLPLMILTLTAGSLSGNLSLISSATRCYGEDASRPKTINLRLTPQWIDSEHFTFRRQTETGQTETVRVVAATGEMTVLTDRDGDGSDGVGGLRGGHVAVSQPGGDSTEIVFINRTAQPIQTSWVTPSGERVDYQVVAAGGTLRQHTYSGHAWVATGADGTFYGSTIAEAPPAKVIIEKSFPEPKENPAAKSDSGSERDSSAEPERPFEVRIRDGEFQYRLKKTGTESESTQRPDWKSVSIPDPIPGDAVAPPNSREGVTLTRPEISPDGKAVAFWIRTPAADEMVHTIESSPQGGGRAKLKSHRYKLPGDAMDRFRLVVVDTRDWQASLPDLPVIDFGYPKLRWRNGHQLLIEKVDRGHQRFRLLAVDPLADTSQSSGNPVSTLIDEQTDTFIWTTHGPALPLVTYLPSGDRAIHASEKSGYRHLYLVDLTGRSPIAPITRGDFLVRKLIHVEEPNVDAAEGYVDLVVGEFHDDQDPYHRHLIRVSLTDGEVTTLTDGDGDHEFEFSPDRKYVIVNHSRVDSPPVHELRRCRDGELLATLAVAKRIGGDRPLPTRFVAKGRDGKTDIWGMIHFPKDSVPTDGENESGVIYPVLENIYAGPHDSHVPKRYQNSDSMTRLTDAGFIVVRIDGMGTANRSKAFHDVAWKNLKDAGFPDRIAWMKAAAKKYPAMDLSRVGIYGTSAGGQNACGALLFHGDFYKAAVAACGCHDNRMDKASWNEQWMGAEIGPHYGECSNIDQAHRLKGDLFLIVGELDSNVPPESTYRLVDALIRADKRFRFLMIPGLGHSDGGDYGRKLTQEFFIEKLQPPTSKNPS